MKSLLQKDLNWDFGVSFATKTFIVKKDYTKFAQINVCINYVILRHCFSETRRIFSSYPNVKFSDG